MGKEVKVTASELLTADKGVRIGKTMSKSDEPTLIPIDEDLSGTKKKTTNKTTGARANASAGKKISVKGPVNKREAERISDAADALVVDDVKPKRTAKNATKAPVKVATKSTAKKTNAKALVMDGMVRQKGATKTVDARGDLDAKADDWKLEAKKIIEKKTGGKSASSGRIEASADVLDEAKKDGKKSVPKKQVSKSKAAIIAIVVAVLVGVVGAVLMFFLNKPVSATCVLRFESNGGTRIDDQEVVCGTKASRPDDPEREGFEFQDWLMEGMPFDFDEETIDKDITVVAKWLVDSDADIVTITFDTAGGSEIAERETIKGKPTTAPLDPTRDGYTFDGWYLDGEEFDFDTPIEEDITLVAGWRASDGTVTRPQGGDSSGDAKKPALQILSVAQGISMKVGQNGTYQIGVNPVSAEVDLEVSSDNKNVADCVVAGTGRSMSCTAANAGTVKVTVKDKISGMTAETTITVTSDSSSIGGGNGGGSNPTPTPTPTSCDDGKELVGGVCKPKCGDDEERDTSGVCQKKIPVCGVDEDLVDGDCKKKPSDGDA